MGEYSPVSWLSVDMFTVLFRCQHVFMGMRFRNHVIQSKFWSKRGTKRDTATIVFIFSIFDQDSALSHKESDPMTPHLLNSVHVAVRSRFEGAQTYGHTRIYICIRKLLRMLRSKIVCSASLTYM